MRHSDEGDRSKEGTFYKEPLPELGPETLPANSLRQTSLTSFRVNHFTSILFQNNRLDVTSNWNAAQSVGCLNPTHTRPNTEDGERETIRQQDNPRTSF